MTDGTTTTTTKGCPECGSHDDWGGTSWCPSCGYYPAINFRQDVSAQPEEEKVYEHWWEVVPGWCWALVAGICAIVVVSLAVRLLFPDSGVRTWWTAGQMIGGLVALCTVHFMAYLYSASRSDQFGPLDMFVRPVATWQPVLRGLPESSNLVCWLGFSVTALLLGYFVVDGIDYIAIMRAEVAARQQARTEQSPEETKAGTKRTCAIRVMMGTASTIAHQQAAAAGCITPNTLEAAMGECSGTQAHYEQLVNATTADPADESGKRNDQQSRPAMDRDIPESIPRDSLPPTHPATVASKFGARVSSGVSMSPREVSPADLEFTKELLRLGNEVECLVLGYTTSASGEIRSILLAAAPDRKFLRFVGKVPVDQVEPDVLLSMMAKFSEIPAARPMVRCPYGGRWVQPELFCIANFDGWTADDRLRNAEVTRLMNTQPN